MWSAESDKGKVKRENCKSLSFLPKTNPSRILLMEGAEGCSLLALSAHVAQRSVVVGAREMTRRPRFWLTPYAQLTTFLDIGACSDGRYTWNHVMWMTEANKNVQLGKFTWVGEWEASWLPQIFGGLPWGSRNGLLSYVTTKKLVDENYRKWFKLSESKLLVYFLFYYFYFFNV